MATTQAVNVLRYSALVAGLVYGVYRQSSITSTAKQAEANREYARQERLIQQAKAEWKKKTAPKETNAQNGGVITDPEDSRFDLEAYLKMKAGEN
ncbi:ATP synthase subunit e [Aspergillus tanneri]|uniref:ATP synthase F(0) complex subunit e, mitochondrial n=1 Tax=Aspergillus tanneri TaxID=1220188 RepID=A0A5M9MH18_9EURO|nr:uncharacterized protein ATNIH1004_011178 [Aspergillus tanneri]KAA8642237.1 hypothetical protein ATNIH1004_011178 [Aspergillus tanneri]